MLKIEYITKDLRTYTGILTTHVNILQNMSSILIFYHKNNFPFK